MYYVVVAFARDDDPRIGSIHKAASVTPGASAVNVGQVDLEAGLDVDQLDRLGLAKESNRHGS